MTTEKTRAERRVMALACRWLSAEDVQWMALTAYECAVQHFVDAYPAEDADFARRQLAGDVSDIFAGLLLEAGRQRGIEGLSSDPQQLRGYLDTQRRDNGAKLSYVARYTSSRIPGDQVSVLGQRSAVEVHLRKRRGRVVRRNRDQRLVQRTANAAVELAQSARTLDLCQHRLRMEQQREGVVGKLDGLHEEAPEHVAMNSL